MYKFILVYEILRKQPNRLDGRQFLVCLYDCILDSVFGWENKVFGYENIQSMLQKNVSKKNVLIYY